MLMFPIIGNPHFVCLKCRRSIKVWDGEAFWNIDRVVPCSTCGAAMNYVGKRFTTPRKKDDAAWKKLEWMIQNGWRGYGWPTQTKMNLRQTQELLAVNTQAEQKTSRKNKEDESLLQRRRAAKYNLSRSKPRKNASKST